MHPRKLTLDTSPSLLTGTAGFDARSVVFCISLLRKSCSWDCEEEQLDRYQDMHQDLCTAEKSFLENCAFMSCLWSCNTWEPWASHTCIRSNKRPGRRAGRAWRMRGERDPPRMERLTAVSLLIGQSGRPQSSVGQWEPGSFISREREKPGPGDI